MTSKKQLKEQIVIAELHITTLNNRYAALRSILQQTIRECGALRKIVKCKSGEIVALRRTIGELRAEVAGLHGRCAALSDELDALKNAQAPVICSRCGRDVLAKDDTIQGRVTPTAPVITLEAIRGLEEDEQLTDASGASVTCEHYGYRVYKDGRSFGCPDAQSALRCVQETPPPAYTP